MLIQIACSKETADRFEQRWNGPEACCRTDGAAVTFRVEGAVGLRLIGRGWESGASMSLCQYLDWQGQVRDEKPEMEPGTAAIPARVTDTRSIGSHPGRPPSPLLAAGPVATGGRRSRGS